MPYEEQKMSSDSAVAESPIVRTPNSPIELLELKSELEKKIGNARKRAVRANHQVEVFERRLVSVSEKLGNFATAGGGDLKAAATKHIEDMQKRMDAIRAQFGL